MKTTIDDRSVEIMLPMPKIPDGWYLLPDKATIEKGDRYWHAKLLAWDDVEISIGRCTDYTKAATIRTEKDMQAFGALRATASRVVIRRKKVEPDVQSDVYSLKTMNTVVLGVGYPTLTRNGEPIAMFAPQMRFSEIYQIINKLNQ